VAADNPIPEVAPVIKNLLPVKSGISDAFHLSGNVNTFGTTAP
jgi:hypothetical protein